MEISTALRPAQAAAGAEQAISSFQIGVFKKAADLQESVVAMLLQGAGIGENVDLKA